MTYTARILAGGKIVIPAVGRRELGLNDGDVVQTERAGDHLVVKSRKQVLCDVQASSRAAIKVPFTADKFLAERAAEAARE